MDAALPIAADPDVLPEDRARLDRQLARLDRLAELGLQIAEGLAAQAAGSGPQVVEGDVALAYDRVARAVRMAVMLQSRLVEDARLPGGRPARGSADPGSHPVPDAADRRKDQIARVVRRVAEDDERLDEFQMSWAARAARERLEHHDIYGQVMSRPVSDVVAAICRDLGLTPDWARLAEEAWARDEIESGAAGAAWQAVPGAGAARDADGAADPAPPRIPTFEDALQALVRDPAIIAAARRESG